MPQRHEKALPKRRSAQTGAHLLKNLGEGLEDLLARHLSASRKHQVEVALQEQTPDWLPEPSPRRSQTLEELPSVYQQDRMARYEQAISLQKQGMTQSAIAQQIGTSLRTVQRWLAADTFPEPTRQHYRSHLDCYLPYVFQRWEQGCHNIAQLKRRVGSARLPGIVHQCA
jgi:Homeodomain-like domain